jgi:PAS domain S-box-containing protein
MTTLESAAAFNESYGTDSSADSRTHLQQLVVRVCLYRLIFLILLLVPLNLVWIREMPARGYFDFFLVPEYTVFFIIGFGATIFFLLFWSRFSNILLFFRLQLFADLVLATYLVLLTGGVTSHLFFIYLGIVFLYGRILGNRAANWTAGLIIAISVVLAVCSFVRVIPWWQPQLAANEVSYYFFLQLLALGLVLMLIKLGYGREDQLLLKIHYQEKALHRSETLKSRVFDWMDSALLVLDHEGRISTLNRKAIELTGNQHYHQVIGRPLDDVFPRLARIWAEWEKEQSFRMEIPQRDGRIFGATFSPVPEEHGTLILFKDITRIKELEERIHQMEKLASIGELAAGLAHEIKNPLAGIKGSLQLINQDSITPENRVQLQQVVQRDIHRLDRLLKDFLVFARPSQANLQQVGLDECIQVCVSHLRNEHTDVAFTVEESLRERYWSWDPDQLKQVLLNLMLNAAQAMEEMAEPWIRIGWAEDRKGEYVFIRDSGPGLDKEMTKSIFDPFVTTKKNGTGLGLSIAQRLAGQNNSWIELHNTEDAGAEARLYWHPEDMQAQR